MDASSAPLLPALPPLPGEQAVAQTARAVLERPDYKLDPNSGDPSAALEVIASMIEAFQNMFNSLYRQSPILYYGFIALMVLVLVLLIYKWFWGAKKLQQDGSGVLLMDDTDPALTEPEVWEKRAAEAEARGELLTALRCLLVGGLMRLERIQKKRLRRGATNREILRRYKASVAFAPLQALVEMVDLKWYGGQACSPADLATAHERHRELCGAAVSLQSAAAAAREAELREQELLRQGGRLPPAPPQGGPPRA
jgi:hypothetical protein